MSKHKKSPGGRKNKYHTHVLPRFEEITAWLRQGCTQEQVYKNLGVGKSSWEKYKNDYPELATLIQESRVPAIAEVENALYKMATGFYYLTEEKQKLKDAQGNESLAKIKLKKFKPPEVGAIAFLLKNWAKEKYTDNPQMMDIKREELELKRKVAEFNDW